MATHRQIFYQLVFATKYRHPVISRPHEAALYKLIGDVVKTKKCVLYSINGMEDHIHIMSDLNPTLCLSDYIRDIKVASNIWMSESGQFRGFEGWQEGYGAFTYSIAEKDSVISYIKNQKRQHQKESFYEEYKRMLEEQQIKFDEKYLL